MGGGDRFRDGLDVRGEAGAEGRRYFVVLPTGAGRRTGGCAAGRSTEETGPEGVGVGVSIGVGRWDGWGGGGGGGGRGWGRMGTAHGRGAIGRAFNNDGGVTGQELG